MVLRLTGIAVLQVIVAVTDDGTTLNINTGKND